MKRKLALTPPFFEIGPKNYLYGDAVYDLAKIADEEADRSGVSVVFTAPYVNIERVRKITKKLHVFAPHMDLLMPGRGLADVLPEAVFSAGAEGVMLNHAEKRLSQTVLAGTIQRAKKIGLMTMVCASSLHETREVAALHPDMIVSEPEELIGTGISVAEDYVKTIMETVFDISADIGVLVAGGVSSADDVYKIIYAGADASGISSGIIKADDPRAMLREMLEAVKAAWEDRNNKSLVC